MFEHGFFGNVLSKYYENGDSVINSSSSGLSTIKPGEFFLCVGAALVIGFLISLIEGIEILVHPADAEDAGGHVHPVEIPGLQSFAEGSGRLCGNLTASFGNYKQLLPPFFIRTF